MSRIFQDQRNCEKTSILIETIKILQIDTFNVSCFSIWVLSTMIQKETAWVFESNDQQSNRMSSEKNSWQMISTRKSAISC